VRFAKRRELQPRSLILRVNEYKPIKRDQTDKRSCDDYAIIIAELIDATEFLNDHKNLQAFQATQLSKVIRSIFLHNR